jgi:hypothetical protein
MSDNQNGDHNIEELTIRDLFALSPDSPPELVAGLEAKDFQEIEKKISSLSVPIPWNRVQSEVAGRISATLNTSLLDAWACAWKKYQDVKNDVEESCNSPDAIVLSRLAEHSIDSTLHPYVEVFLGRNMIQKITFDVTLTTQLKGLVLGLKNGRIVSLQLAQCQWTGSIATEGITLIERKLTELNLPGRITLKRGISLVSQGNN